MWMVQSTVVYTGIHVLVLWTASTDSYLPMAASGLFKQSNDYHRMAMIAWPSGHWSWTIHGLLLDARGEYQPQWVLAVHWGSVTVTDHQWIVWASSVNRSCKHYQNGQNLKIVSGWSVDSNNTLHCPWIVSELINFPNFIREWSLALWRLGFMQTLSPTSSSRTREVPETLGVVARYHSLMPGLT